MARIRRKLREETSAQGPRVPPRVESAIVALLLLVMAVALGLAAREDGMTVDEMPYIGSGYRSLFFSDYRLMPEHPPLAKMIEAAPLALLPLRVPEAQEGDAQIPWSDAFVNGENRDQPIVLYARVPIVAATLLLAFLLYRLARSLYGSAPALFLLALVAFHPSLLAHGHLATTDVLSTLTMFLASWAFYAWSRRPSPVAATRVGLAVAAAVCTRFTAWLLGPIFGVLALFWLVARERHSRGRALRDLLVLVAVSAAAITVVMWAVYGFHYEPWPGRSCAQPIDAALGIPGRIVALLQQHHILPEAYLEGLRYQLQHNHDGHWCYFMGESGWSGWRSYYLVAFVVKNTPGFLMAAALAVVFLVRRAKEMARDRAELHFLVPLVTIAVVASLTRIQLGERYILAAYPYLLLLVAAAARWALAWKHAAKAAAVVFLLHAVPSVAIAPRGYLTYFNPIAGGPDNGHRFLADSNLDWGQDLPRLAAWMKKKGLDHIQLGYFGADDADRYGIRHEDLPTWYPNRPQFPAAQPFHGTAAISANLMVGFLFPPAEDPYLFLRGRAPDERVGTFFIYRFP